MKKGNRLYLLFFLFSLILSRLLLFLNNKVGFMSFFGAQLSFLKFCSIIGFLFFIQGVFITLFIISLFTVLKSPELSKFDLEKAL